MKPSLTGQIVRGAEITLPLVYELNALRVAVMSLKPDVDVAQDFADVVEFCRASAYVGFLRTPAGALVGSLAVRIERGAFAGTRYRLVVPNYTFVAPEFRGHPAFRRIGLRMFVQMLLAYRGEAMFLGGVGYPASALAIERVLPPVHLLSDPNVPPLERHLLERLVRDVGGTHWDAARGRMTMPTVPPAMSASWNERALRTPLYHRYLAQCPDWADGFALPVVARVHPLRVFKNVGPLASPLRGGR